MPASLPTTDCLDRVMWTFGIGTYDSAQDVATDEGENDVGYGHKSLPPIVDSEIEFEEDDDITAQCYTPKGVMPNLSASLPGDYDLPPRGYSNKIKDIKYNLISDAGTSEIPFDDRTSASKLPHNEYNQSSVVGYSDKSSQTSSKKHSADAELPGPVGNYQTLDNELGSLGNWWSGQTYEDVAQPISFPTADRPYNWVDQFFSVPTGYASSRTGSMKKIATNLNLVNTLTSDFYKKYGKEKSLTKRHVMAFLQENGYHVYLSSDIIRCLQGHNIYIADVLDQFPVKTASDSSNFDKFIASKLIDIHKKLSSAYGEPGGLKIKILADRIASTIDEIYGK
jgi:hypothetical protein